MDKTLDVEVACKLTALPDLQARLAAFAEEADLPPRVAFGIDLVADEIVSNIIRHGFCETVQNPDIRCEVRLTPGEAVIAFTDNGPPFDPLTEAPPPDLTEDIETRAVGGLGVHLVKAMSDRVRYVRKDDRNRLEVTWVLEPETPD